MFPLDVLIPTYRRPAALAVTLTSLIGQRMRDFRVVISDQTEQEASTDSGEVVAAIRVLRARGCPVNVHRHLPRRGLAEQRQFLLDQASAPYVLFLDDDVILEPEVVERLYETIQEEQCGFVGAAVIGLSFLADVRPNEQQIEFWRGHVKPETVRPGSLAWERYRLHNAANLFHVEQRLHVGPHDRLKYKVAWVGGCVLYRGKALQAVGGFEFWRDLPAEHCGEDVLAQLRVMAEYGGCGVLPSGVYHQELPTTVQNRAYDAPRILDVDPTPSSSATEG